MQKKILIIDNYDSFTYNLRQIVEEFLHDYSIVMNDELNIEEVEQYNKILISPGPGLPSDTGKTREVIKRYAEAKSILGICLGHQTIAEMFGGELYNFNQVRHGLAVQIKILDSDEYLFKNIPTEFEVGLYHSWAVSQNNFPNCLKITSISNDDVIMSFSHIKYDVKGVQFHPESIMTNYGKQIIKNWLEH